MEEDFYLEAPREVNIVFIKNIYLRTVGISTSETGGEKVKDFPALNTNTSRMQAENLQINQKIKGELFILGVANIGADPYIKEISSINNINLYQMQSRGSLFNCGKIDLGVTKVHPGL